MANATGAEYMELQHLLIRAHADATPVAAPAESLGVEAAYAVQRAVFGQAGLPVKGWKIGLTAEGARAAFGAEEPAAGRLADVAVLSDRADIPYHGPEMYAEAELVVQLACDLPPSGAPYSHEQVASAVRTLHPGIELVRSRFSDSDLRLGLLLADNVMAHALIVGAPFSQGWLEACSAMDVTLDRAGAERVAGSTMRVMGNPLDALVWLANWLAAHENGLKEGQLVATGTCTGATEVHAGDEIVVRFADVCEVHASITDGTIKGDKK